MGKPKFYDFSGYATRANVRCLDGRTIKPGAFKDCDGMTVPLVYMHNHKSADNVLGHAYLENRDDGVYTYGVFNATTQGKNARELVAHGDITSLSIYANNLRERAHAVYHGDIKEVSLVLAGANSGAYIDNVCIQHSDGELEEIDSEAEISFMIPFDTVDMKHSDEEEDDIPAPKKKKKAKPDPDEDEDPEDDDDEDPEDDDEEEEMTHKIKHSDEDANSKKPSNGDKTVGDVLNTLNEDQQIAVAYLLEQAKKGKKGKEDDESSDEVKHSDEGGEVMKSNVFDQDVVNEENTLSHAEMLEIMDEAKETGSLKKAFLAHGISNIDYLFPEAKLVRNQPDMITRPMEWVPTVWNGLHKSPFSRIRSQAADITGEEARAKGYIKGDKKEDEVISLLRRETTPQTVYKLQKLDRDDIIDITDLDVVAWIKAEMRTMLDEELSRAVLIGDGRSVNDRFKIKEEHIRPIYKEDDLYCIKYRVHYSATDDSTDIANAIIEGAIRSRKDYRGSGSPTLFCSTDTLTTLLLSRDKIGRLLYKSEAEIAAAMRVSRIVEVPALEGLYRTVTENGTEKQLPLLGIIINLSDYTVGADKGGSVNMFDDFDIDYNKYTYLIETRISGALTLPFSAIVLEAEISNENPKLEVTMDLRPEVSGLDNDDIQSNMNLGGTIVYGDLHYLTNYDNEAIGEDPISGHYLMIHVEASKALASVSASIGGTTMTSLGNGNFIGQVSNKAQKLVVTGTLSNYQTYTKTYKLNGLRLEGATPATVM